MRACALLVGLLLQKRVGVRLTRSFPVRSFDRSTVRTVQRRTVNGATALVEPKGGPIALFPRGPKGEYQVRLGTDGRLGRR